MQFSFGFYSSLLLIFFVHTVVYSVLFLFKYKKHQQPSSLWMSLFLCLVALYIAPWMLGFAGWYSCQPYRDILFYVPFQHLYIIGPCIFFYVQSIFNPKFSVTKKTAIHFVPALLYLIFCVVMVVYDKLIVHQYYFLKNQQDPDFDNWYQITGFISMIGYLIASIKYYYQYKKAIQEVVSNAADFLFTWIRNFLIAFLVMQFAWLVLAIYGLLYHNEYANTWWYFFSFAIISYYIAIAGYSNAVEAKIFFKTKLFGNQNNALLLSQQQPYYLEYTATNFEELELEEEIDTPEILNNFADWKLKIENLLQIEKMYEEPELTLFGIAKKLNTNISFLSKAINKGFNSNFNDLINNYRVQAVINLLNQEEHKKQTLLSIAFECGFNSKSTFNRAFKKLKGISPQEYIKQL